jgi:hypothetical protein
MTIPPVLVCGNSYREYRLTEEKRRNVRGFAAREGNLCAKRLVQRRHTRHMSQIPDIRQLTSCFFSSISSPNKQRVLELGQGSQIQEAEPILLVGHPGLEAESKRCSPKGPDESAVFVALA